MSFEDLFLSSEADHGDADFAGAGSGEPLEIIETIDSELDAFGSGSPEGGTWQRERSPLLVGPALQGYKCAQVLRLPLREVVRQCRWQLKMKEFDRSGG